MKKIPINEGSVKQLRYHAETVLGLELAAVGLNRGQIIAKIEAAAPGTTEIQFVEDAGQPRPGRRPSRTPRGRSRSQPAKVVEAEKTVDRLAGMSAKQAAQHHNDPTIELYIPQSAEAGGDRDVPVSVNGMQWLIQRDKWIKVPYRVFIALKHAEETRSTTTPTTTSARCRSPSARCRPTPSRRERPERGRNRRLARTDRRRRARLTDQSAGAGR
jgi:hypothetical protein